MNTLEKIMMIEGNHLRMELYMEDKMGWQKLVRKWAQRELGKKPS
ncbi:hypothetical protein LCGC14_0740260 [marine sediment metagenome]|uniref:Uncharacterized protein n=1 Tax=marine sediment metagenome TaxID=412755 RepID=A0A0F9QRW9_9ZZZZ